MLSKKETVRIRRSLPSRESSLLSAFHALGDHTRYRMFALLAAKGGLCVTDVARIFFISVPAASHQLKILERAGLVRGERFGQTICYEIRKESTPVSLLAKLIAARAVSHNHAKRST